MGRALQMCFLTIRHSNAVVVALATKRADLFVSRCLTIPACAFVQPHPTL
jgi:hypothetical protein